MRTPLAAAAFVSVTLAALGHARAAVPTDCPPGSVGKEEGRFAWCEPTVCRNDADCLGGDQVCRSAALCMQVGSLDTDASLKGGASPDAAKRLMVAGRCAPSEPRCPADQTCSDMLRCMTRADAQRMGILDLPAQAPSATASAAPQTDTGKPPPRCGCDVPGAPIGGAWGLVGLVGVAMLAGRRRR